MITGDNADRDRSRSNMRNKFASRKQAKSNSLMKSVNNMSAPNLLAKRYINPNSKSPTSVIEEQKSQDIIGQGRGSLMDKGKK